MANTTTNHTDKNTVEAVVNRTQLEAIFKEEHSAQPTCNNEATSKVSKAYAANFRNSGTEQLRFGKRYWEGDKNWPYFIQMISPFLLNKHWWHLHNNGEEVELVLHCAADDTTWAQPEQMHYRTHAIKDVHKLLESSYDELVEHAGWTQTERDVLLGKFEGAPEQASDAEGSEDNDDEDDLFGDESGEEADTHQRDDTDGLDESDTECEALEEWKVVEESYTGDMDNANTHAHGYGVLTRRLQEIHIGHEKITRYYGKFFEGLQNGPGEEKCDATEELWRGDWDSGLQHGLGEWHYTNGSVFRGTFKGGKPEGAGTYLPASSDKRLPGLFTCEDGALHRKRAGDAEWPAEFEKGLDLALHRAHEAATRAQSAAEAAEHRAQRREETMNSLAESGFSQGPQERKETREMRIALAAGGRTLEHSNTLIAAYDAALACEDGEQLKEAEDRVLFAVALAHRRLKGLIKEHETGTGGDYSKTSKYLETPEAVEAAHKAFIMQVRIFELRRLDIHDCAKHAPSMVEHYRKKDELEGDGLPNAARIKRLMQSVQVKSHPVRVDDARKRENLAKRGSNAQSSAQQESMEAYARLSKAHKIKHKREEFKQLKRQQEALSKKLTAVQREIELLEGASEEEEGEGAAAE